MQSTTICSRGDIVLVPFPFTDLTGVKPRPALVVSGDVYAQHTNDVIVAQITSNVGGRPRFGDYYIRDWRQAGLRAPSMVRAKLATLAWARVRRTLGQLPTPEMQAVERELRVALGM
jgi:mRNA interferase MazF